MGDEKGVMVGGGGGDGGDEGMVCREHPYRNNPGGICAFCLQEKLGKLVSSTNSNTPFFPLHPPPSSNNSSPPSFRSVNTSSTSASTSAALPSITITTCNGNSNGRAIKTSKIPSFLSRPTSTHNHHHYKHNKKDHPPKSSSSSSITNTNTNTNTTPSSLKSVVPRPTLDKNTTNRPTLTADSPRKKSFWSFLYLSSSSSSSPTSIGTNFSTNTASLRRRSVSSYSSSRSQPSHQNLVHLESITDDKSEEKFTNKPSIVVVEEDETLSPGATSQNQSQASSSSFGRKVARSRSVGCGSRSFSGDFLERLSNGFGDCTLRRVESHRESNNKPNKLVLHGHLDNGDENEMEQRMRRIRCSGFFSSSASSYWLSANHDHNGNRARMSTGGGGRNNRSGWGWTFASPMRAFKPTTSNSSNSSIKSMPQSNVLPPQVT